MRVIVCGGRKFADYRGLCNAMSHLGRPSIIIQGGALGADALAKRWAVEHGVHCAEVPAMWRLYDKKAGHLRNAAMMSLQPEFCVAMPGGPGTRGMVQLCKDAGVPVLEYPAWPH